jgi:hypothetical protein
VLYGPNGKPLYAFYARDPSGNPAAVANRGGQKLKETSTGGMGLSESDKEIERKVLFKLLREEEQQVRQQQLDEKSAGARATSSWGVSLLVSLFALAAPLLMLR